MLWTWTAPLSHAADRSQFFAIQVVDEQTGRGVPLVELETVNHLRFETDSAGRVAFHEPGLMNATVFFSVRSHGYEVTKDGFGQRGVRLEAKPGTTATIKLRRINVAERLYRITGQGIYRDTVLLGETVPIDQPVLNAQVVGQDSIQPAIYRGKLFWFWGDTSRASYPLGNFRTTGATSELPGRGGLDPSVGINLLYFTNAEGFTKQMVPIEPKGELVWIDGLLVVKDAPRGERMIAHYQRRKSLSEMLEHGLIEFDDAKEEFVRLKVLEFNDRWHFPRGHPLKHLENGVDWFYFGDAVPNVRVRAERGALTNELAYESFTCMADGDSVARDANGAVQWRWQRVLPPLSPAAEQRLVARGALQTNETRFNPVDVDSGKVVRLHGGTVKWNEYRHRWILIVVQQGGTSALGEVWFSEADAPTGPWRRAKKIVTHEKYSFYNPAQHEFFDQQGGRLIFFEGTYSETFSGNPNPTPLYDYNQIMYRLDLSDARLKAVQ